MISRNAITAFLLVLFTGCSQKSAQERLVEFVNDPDNKIKQSIQVGDVMMVAKWLPHQYRNPWSKQVDEEDYYYFDVQFQKKKGNKPTKEQLLYLDFDMRHDFVLVCGKDSIHPALCQRITNGIAANYQYLVAFDNSNKEISNRDFTLLYNDNVFATGIIGFVYKQKDINKISQL